MLVLKMINGALVGVSTADDRTAAASRALEIALYGLGHLPPVPSALTPAS
jgi:hypothetical protein